MYPILSRTEKKDSLIIPNFEICSKIFLSSLSLYPNEILNNVKTIVADNYVRDKNSFKVHVFYHSTTLYFISVKNILNK